MQPRSGEAMVLSEPTGQPAAGAPGQAQAQHLLEKMPRGMENGGSPVVEEMLKTFP